MRRSRIQVKPLLNVRSTRPTSDNSVRSQEASSKKENESLTKSAEGGTVSSVPATAGTNSSTSSEPKLNFRRPAFSVRPRPSIRSLSIPNLHGTQPTPILVASSSQQKETVSSGDGVESIVKESKDPASVAVPLDVKENPVTEVNRKDTAKHISENKEDSTILPRIEHFQIQDEANFKTSTVNLSTNQAVAIDAAAAASVCASEDGTKETEVSMDKVTSQDGVASKQMTPKTERPALQKRGRFLAQLKLNAEMANWSSASSNSSVSSSTFSSAIPPSTSTPSTPSPSTNPTPTPSTPAFSTTPFPTSTPPSSATLSSTPPSSATLSSITPSVTSSTLTTPPALTSSSKTPVESQSAVPISKVNQKTNSKMKEDNQDTFAVISKKSDTIMTEMITSSDGDHFEIPSKTEADAEDQSSTSSTKPPESESLSISTSATSTLASGDNKQNDDSQINVTNKNDDDVTTTTIDKELTTQPAKDVPVLSRRMRFPIRPKLASQSKDESQSSSVGEKTSEETLMTSNEITSVVKTSVLSRRSRFQIQPKPSGKTLKQSSLSVVNMSSTSPSDNELTSKSSQDVTISTETEDNKQKEESGNHFANIKDTANELPSKREMTTSSVGDHFEIPSKTETDAEDQSSSTKPPESESLSISTPATSTLASGDDKLNDDSQINVANKNDDDAITITIDKELTTEPAKMTVLPRRNRFQIQPKPSTKTSQPSNSLSLSDNGLTLESSQGDTPTLETNKENTGDTAEELPPKSEPTSVPTLSRRSRFQVQPKVRPSQSKDKKPNVPVDEQKAKISNEDTSKSESAILPRRNRFQVKPKPGAKSTEQSASVATSTTVGTNESVSTTDIPVTSVEMVTSDSDNKQTVDSGKSDEHLSSTDAAPKIESAMLPRRNRFQVKPKPGAKSTEQSSSVATSTKVETNESASTTDIPLTSVEMVTSDSDNKQTVDSGKNDEHLSSTDAAPKTESAILPRRNRFQVKPKPGAKSTEPSSDAASTKVGTNESITKKDIPLTSVERVMSDSDNKQSVDSGNNDEDATSTDAAPKIESAILPRRNRFQVKPKPGAKSTEPSSSAAVSTKVRTNESVTKKDIPLMSVEKVISDADVKQAVDSGNDDEDATSTDAAQKIESAILPRRNRFQVKPKPGAKSTEPSSVAASTKVGANESVTKKDLPLASVERVMSDSDKKQTVDSGNNDEDATSAAPKIESAILPRRNRFQVKPKPGAKSTEPSSSVAASTKVGTNESVTKKDIPLTSVEKVTSDSDKKQTVDSGNNDEDATSTDAAPKIEKTPALTLSRRSRFQVRPKLGTSKDLPKIPSNPNETKEKRVEKTPSKFAASIVSILNTSANDDQRKKEEGQAASPQKNMIQNEQIRSESSKSSEKSLADSSVQSPVKLTGKNSSSNLSSPLKDNIQIENIKQREYPVNVHKSSGKSSKSLPLREKQKKPDVSVHPSDKPPDKGKMKMRDLIYWNPSSNPMKSPDAKRARPVRQSEESPTKPIEQTSDENEPIAVPQVKIGADGNIVLNEESLVINNSQPTAPVTMEVVDETDVYSNYGSFRRYTPKSKWSLKETKKFFLALSSVGTDFSLMTNLFTKKSRRDLKNKFKREERNNRWLVDKAIRQQLHFDEKLFEEISESDEEDVEPPTKKSRQKKDSTESLNKKEKKSGKSKKDSATDSSVTAKKSKQKITESEEGEPSTKKSRKKKDSSENPKTKGKKSKASKTDSPSTAKKTKKSKQMSSKDWVIDSQEDAPGLSEGIVEEEPVMNEILIIPENAPFAEDALTRTEPRVPRSQSQEEEVVNILIEMGQNVGRDSRAQQSSQVPPSVCQNKHPATPMPTVNTPSTPITVVSNKPGVSNRAKSIRKVRQDVSVPGSSGSSHVATNSVATSEEARDNGSLARLFLQQMGLNSQLNALQDEIVSITEAEISNNEQIQKVILVEVQPKDQKQTVVHMYLVSRHDSTQPCSDGSAGGQVTVSAAQPLTLQPTTPNLSDTPAIDPSIVNEIKASTPDTATSPSS